MATNATILAAEDDAGDQLLLRLAFKEIGLLDQLVIVSNGVEVMDYLFERPPYEDRTKHPLPGLLLLDIKMPKMNGFEVLMWLRTCPEFRSVPVVIVSGSPLESDKEATRQLGAQEYLVKPICYRELGYMLKDVVERWVDLEPQPA